MLDWAKKDAINDVSTAVDSQTIQTVLERQNTGISDVGFQSYLTNVPIPRMFRYTTVATTILAGAIAVVDFTTASTGSFDPYSMYIGGSTWRIPIDGFYNITFCGGYPSNGLNFQAYAAIMSNKGTYGAGTLLSLNETVVPAAVANMVFNVVALRPFRAGDEFYAQYYNGSTTNQNSVNFALATTTIGATWVAPFNSYTTQGGN